MSEKLGFSTGKGYYKKPYDIIQTLDVSDGATEVQITKKGLYIVHLLCETTQKGEAYTSLVMVDDLSYGTIGTRVQTVNGTPTRTLWAGYQISGHKIYCSDDSGYADITTIKSVHFIEC